MKRRDLIRKIEKLDCVFIRHGGRHDWYQNPDTGALNLCPAIVKSKTTLPNT